jgi:dTMP kinase
MTPKRFYGAGLPGIESADLGGMLIVIEGPDGSGRSTQTRIIKDWLESRGHAVTVVGLRRSTLVAQELSHAKQGHVLGHTTMSLFYATDFADQLEHIMIPALRAGYIVLADRFIYTLMARAICRGADRSWLESMYGMAIVPDAVFYLKVRPAVLAERTLEKYGTLDFWESGLDLGLAPDMYDSFLKYQTLVQHQFTQLQQQYGFVVINGNRTVRAVAAELRRHLEPIVDQGMANGRATPHVA